MPTSEAIIIVIILFLDHPEESFTGSTHDAKIRLGKSLVATKYR